MRNSSVPQLSVSLLGDCYFGNNKVNVYTMGERKRPFIKHRGYGEILNILLVLCILLIACFPLPARTGVLHKIKLRKLVKYGIIGAALLPRYVPIGVPVHHSFGEIYEFGGHGDYGVYGSHGSLGAYGMLNGGFENFRPYGAYGGFW